MTEYRDEKPGDVTGAAGGGEAQPAPADDKKSFVEPAVSVPADVLEATALFQAPTVQTSVVP